MAFHGKRLQLSQRLIEVLDQIVGIFETDRQSQEAFRRSCSGPSIDARCSIKLSTPPRLVARVKIFVFAATDIAASRPSFTSNESIPPKRASTSVLRRSHVRDATSIRDNGRAQLFDVAQRKSATFIAFSECARIRHGNVRIPRKISQQSKGEGTAPPSY